MTSTQWWGFGCIVGIAEVCPQPFIVVHVVDFVVWFVVSEEGILVPLGLFAGVDTGEQNREWDKVLSQRIKCRMSGFARAVRSRHRSLPARLFCWESSHRSVMLCSRYCNKSSNIGNNGIVFRCLGHNGCEGCVTSGLVRLGGRRQDPTSSKKERRTVRWCNCGTCELRGPWIWRDSRRRCELR